MDIKSYVYEISLKAKSASKAMLRVSTQNKNLALQRMAELLRKEKERIFSENRKDIEYAKEKGLSGAMIDRLTLNDKRIDEMCSGLIEVSNLSDPVFEITKMWQRPNGMLVGKMRTPIGLIAIIYESRPNVTVDATSLCLKSGNAVLLRGGSEALRSNRILVDIMKTALRETGIQEDVITFIDTPEREAINELLKLSGIIDLVIPRGGEGLIRTVTENSRIPVLKHYKGVCHVFVDRDADLRMAEEICFNAKVQRPGTCNAMETMLVDREIADRFLPAMLKRFRDAGVRIKGCPLTKSIFPDVEDVREEDYYNEYLALILNVRVVSSMDEAMEHISIYGSQHSDTIVTENYERAMRFIKEVDSSAVFVNASTRLNDGYQFGLGAEIGISTDKIHARGPMGLLELTCTKFIVFGSGQLRE